MALANWTVTNNLTSGGVTAFITCGSAVFSRTYPATGITTAWSTPCFSQPAGLAMAATPGGTSQGINAIVTSNVNHRQSGTIKATVRQVSNNIIDGIVSPPNSPINFGVTCMQSQGSLEGSGRCYALIMDSVNNANTVQLIRMTSGIGPGVGAGPSTTYEQLFTTSPAAWSLNTDYELQLFWRSDPFFLKGTQLIGTFNGTQLFDFVHTGPGAIATVSSSGEGIYAAFTTNSPIVIWTATTIVPTAIINVNAVAYPPIVG